MIITSMEQVERECHPHQIIYPCLMLGVKPGYKSGLIAMMCGSARHYWELYEFAILALSHEGFHVIVTSATGNSPLKRQENPNEE